MGTVVMSQHEFDQFIAEHLDNLTTLAASAGRYVRTLEKQGIHNFIAQQLAASWLSEMQDKLL